MTLFQLDIGWAVTASERRYLRWELIAAERVLGVFLTARKNVLAVLFSGDRRDFDAWSRTLAHVDKHGTANTHEQGAFS